MNFLVIKLLFSYFVHSFSEPNRSDPIPMKEPNGSNSASLHSFKGLKEEILLNQK